MPPPPVVLARNANNIGPKEVSHVEGLLRQAQHGGYRPVTATLIAAGVGREAIEWLDDAEAVERRQGNGKERKGREAD